MHLGDREYALKTITWLTVTYRRSGQLEKVRQNAARSLEIATASKTPLYIGLAKANQAWVAWREGNLVETQEIGRAALDLLEQGKVVIFSKWLALMPLIEAALRQSNDLEAIGYVRTLLNPTQMYLSEGLEEIFTQAVKAWDEKAIGQAHARMQQGLGMAQQTGWM